MSDFIISKIPPVKKDLKLPGDKSISHRAVMLSSIAKGETLVKNYLPALDCQNTKDAFKKMGVSIEDVKQDQILIRGNGLSGFKKPGSEIYLGNSGTSVRLLLGILAGQPFETVITGDESLKKRPMKRVTRPLRMMGAQIEGADDANFLPLKIRGGELNAISYDSPIASAQVKSCIMLAALFAKGTTKVTEPYKSRDHTERMFKLFGANVSINGNEITVYEGASLKSPGEIVVPSDISSASFFIALGLLLPDSEILIKSCGINPTRTGFIEVLKRMGADIQIMNQKGEDYEPYADILVKHSELHSTVVRQDEIPKMIDEVPVLALVSAHASGKSVIEGVEELKVKETDRVHSIVSNLACFGANISARKNKIIIEGPARLKGAKVKSFGDHRTAMAMVIAGALSEGETTVEDCDCIDTSFPGFLSLINELK